MPIEHHPPGPALVPPIPNSYIVPRTCVAAGEYPASSPRVPRHEARAKLQAFLGAGIRAFVDLTTPDDALEPYFAELQQLAGEQAPTLRHHRLEIPDMGVCSPAFMNRILDVLDEETAREAGTYVHCWGGVGRTGIVIGCWLVRRGLSGEEALAEVGRLFATMSPAKVARHAAWGSPQTDAQRALVRGWAAHDRVVGERGNGVG